MMLLWELMKCTGHKLFTMYICSVFVICKPGLSPEHMSFSICQDGYVWPIKRLFSPSIASLKRDFVGDYMAVGSEGEPCLIYCDHHSFKCFSAHVYVYLCWEKRQ